MTNRQFVLSCIPTAKLVREPFFTIHTGEFRCFFYRVVDTETEKILTGDFQLPKMAWEDAREEIDWEMERILEGD